MKGIILNCPEKGCRKMLAKSLYLRYGSFFTVRCFHCGSTIQVCSTVGTLEITILKSEFAGSPADEDLTEDDDDDIFVSTA